MNVSLREKILKCKDIQTEKVHIPEWSVDIYVRGLTGKERDRYEASLLETRGRSQVTNYANARAKMVILAACDENGDPVFTQADLQELTDKSAAALDRIFSVARRLSGMDEDDINELVNDLKNDPSAGSGSD